MRKMMNLYALRFALRRSRKNDFVTPGGLL
ncbi:hypothetical protein LINGRAHAP2_LOCUS1904 [Linum grandiflorum]